MASPSKAEIVGLDIVRGIAAILVMLVHTRDSAFVDYGKLPASDHSPIVLGLFAITRVGHALGALVCAAGIIFFELGSSSKSFANVVIVPQAVAELLICAGFALTLPFLCSDALNRRIAFLNKPAKWISSISFSLYLFHAIANIQAYQVVRSVARGIRFSGFLLLAVSSTAHLTGEPAVPTRVSRRAVP